MGRSHGSYQCPRFLLFSKTIVQFPKLERTIHGVQKFKGMKHPSENRSKYMCLQQAHSVTSKANQAI